MNIMKNSIKSTNQKQHAVVKQISEIKRYLLFIILNILLMTLALIVLTNLVYGQSSQTLSGNTFSLVPISGATAQWTSNVNAKISDDAYAGLSANLPNSGNYTDYLFITDFQFNLPAGSTINGITVNVERSDANGKSKDYRVQLIKSGTIGGNDKALTPAWSGIDAVQTYGGSSDLWGSMWTYSDINSSGFGFAFAAQRTGGGGQPTLAKVDAVSITVFYTAPLPVELTNFNSISVNHAVYLSWETASEINNNYFTVERSKDGIFFTELFQISGAGNSSIVKQYACADNNPFPGVSYYRLKQTDFDGQSEIFKTVSVAATEKAALVITPNSFSESFTTQFALSEQSTVEIQIINVLGTTVYKQSLNAEKGNNIFQFLTPLHFKNGNYLLRVINNNQLIATANIVCKK
jgi:hypothetical protein